MMTTVIIDGQGGRLGALLTEAVIKADIRTELIAIGTNSAATGAMLKAGAVNAATGENPVIVACRSADVIIGPVGIVAADSLLGEVTPKMAVAIGQSKAVKLLLPVSHCNNRVVGVEKMALSEMVASAVETLKALIV